MQTHLHFSYEWHLAATPAAVWQVLTRLDAWPLWWSAVTDVEQVSVGNERGEGAVLLSLWKGWLSRPVAVEMRTLVAEENILLVTKSSGAMQGLGRWELTEIPVGVRVRYTGKVSLTPFLQWFYPVLKPFMYAHYQHTMRTGAEGLARQLGVELIDCQEVAYEIS
ncbi:MAG: hypothetical protein HOP20_04390 [Sulfuriferula sp.]|nr:hypothetical protein [Sulfuriferula sp.]